MKIYELLNEAAGTKPSFDQIKTKVFDTYLSLIKVPSELKANIKDELENDHHWTDLIHDINDAAEKGDYEQALDYFSNAVEEISQNVADFYGDSWNFAPGSDMTSSARGSKENIPVVDTEKLSKKFWDQISDFLVPGGRKAAASAQKTAQRDREKIARGFLTQVVETLKKHDAAGWAAFHATIQKWAAKGDKGLKYIDDAYLKDLSEVQAVTATELAQAKDGEALKRICLKKMSAEEYLWTLDANMSQIKGLKADEQKSLSQILPLIRNKKTRQQIYDQVK